VLDDDYRVHEAMTVSWLLRALGSVPLTCPMCLCRRFAAVRRIADTMEFNNSLFYTSDCPVPTAKHVERKGIRASVRS
jgi:hypothetical protein